MTFGHRRYKDKRSACKETSAAYTNFGKWALVMKVIGIAGWSGAGKTTLISRVLPHLRQQGLRVSVIKHAHHDFDVDVPGKDSWVHRQSGAVEVVVSSANRWALMHELRGAAEPELPELLGKMSPVDLVVIEGFKSERHRKIEVHRQANGKPPLFPGDPAIAGIATDVAIETTLPVVHFDDIPAVAAMMRQFAIPVEEVLAARVDKASRADKA
jgi:molybdopterin-guanine dinucleotide biosynthesis adapter protein